MHGCFRGVPLYKKHNFITLIQTFTLFLLFIFARKRLKAEKEKTSKSTKSAAPNTRSEQKKHELKKEKNRLSQQKRRALMTPQKKKWELKKQRDRYWKSNCTKTSPEKPKKKAKITLDRLLKGVTSSLKNARTKLALFKLDFAKKLLNRNHHSCVKDINSFYKRPPMNSFCVERFFNKMAVDFPGQRGSSAPKKVLTKKVEDLYNDFKKAHSDVKISLSTFKRRRPNNILLTSSHKFVQCLCERCTNVMLLMAPINSELPGLHKITNIDELVKKTLCHEPRRECFERKCLHENCSSKNFIDKLKDLLSEKLNRMKRWSRWERTEKSSKDLVQMESCLSDILQRLESSLQEIAMHLKVAHWQRSRYQILRDNLPPGHAMCTLDFAENYLCKFQNEVQSAHWSYRQISIHPCVFFYRCPNVDNSNCLKTITDYKIFMSDDLNHDSFFAKHVIEECIKYAISLKVSVIHFYSDGCSSQYKSKFAMYHLSDLQVKYPNIAITRHFFGSSHGKSLCDSAGGTVKNAAARSVLAGTSSIQSANDMFQFCNDKLLIPASSDCSHIQSVRSFVLVARNDINRNKKFPGLKPLKGIRDIHSFKAFTIKTVNTRPLSCFCEVCLTGEAGQCPNIDLCLNSEEKTIAVENKERNDLNRGRDQTSRSMLVTNVTNDSQFLYFSDVLKLFLECNTFQELKACVETVCGDLETYSLNSLPSLFTPKALKSVGSLDSNAKRFVPPYLSHLSPAEVTSDGNCIPRSLSLHCFGDENHHIEIRCRIICELVRNQHDYLCLDAEEIHFLCQHSPTFSDTVEQTFQNEVLHMCKKSTYMGKWQLMAAANALNISIFSVYPSQGPPEYKQAYNTAIHPFTGATPYLLPILWCATKDHNNRMPDNYWTANHVVPLMGETEPILLTLEVL